MQGHWTYLLLFIFFLCLELCYSVTNTPRCCDIKRLLHINVSAGFRSSASLLKVRIMHITILNISPFFVHKYYYAIPPFLRHFLLFINIPHCVPLQGFLKHLLVYKPGHWRRLWWLCFILFFSPYRGFHKRLVTRGSISTPAWYCLSITFLDLTKRKFSYLYLLSSQILPSILLLRLYILVHFLNLFYNHDNCYSSGSQP